MPTSRLRAPAARRVLFLTHFSASPRTAIGVQTGRLLAAVPQHLHLYFATPKHYRNSERLLRLEQPLVARAGRLQRPNPVTDVLAAAGLTWWRNGELRPSKAARVAALRDRVSVAYVSPLNAEDAHRMRRVVELVGRPFVLHLWDSLSGAPGEDPDLRWLVEHASRVLVLSEPLLEEVRALGAEGEILLFSRGPAARAARFDGGGPMRIALLGLLDPYADGVVLLDRARDLLDERGIATEVVYIGAARSAETVNRRLRRPLQATGFVRDDRRDAILAGCSVGFVPGPSADPAHDMRSRYSVPSRSLDFLAHGLPAVGAVHPASATGRFSASLGVAEGLCCRDPEELAAALAGLRDPEAWRRAHERAARAWDLVSARPPAERLAELLLDVAGPVAGRDA